MSAWGLWLLLQTKGRDALRALTVEKDGVDGSRIYMSVRHDHHTAHTSLLPLPKLSRPTLQLQASTGVQILLCHLTRTLRDSSVFLHMRTHHIQIIHTPIECR